jgi:hypothetical protein
MITHLVHFTFEAVEKMADEPPAKDNGAGQLLIWIGAIVGAFILGNQAVEGFNVPARFGLPATNTAFTPDHLPTVVGMGCAGALAGACAGAIVFGIALFVVTKARATP